MTAISCPGVCQGLRRDKTEANGHVLDGADLGQHAHDKRDDQAISVTRQGGHPDQARKLAIDGRVRGALSTASRHVLLELRRAELGRLEVTKIFLSSLSLTAAIARACGLPGAPTRISAPSCPTSLRAASTALFGEPLSSSTTTLTSRPAILLVPPVK